MAREARARGSTKRAGARVALWLSVPRHILGVMNPKPRPNNDVYVRTLRRMTPEQRLAKAFELTEMTRELLWTGLKQRFPEKPEGELRDLYLRRLEKCHNRDF